MTTRERFEVCQHGRDSDGNLVGDAVACEFPPVRCEFHGGHDAGAVALMQAQGISQAVAAPPAVKIALRIILNHVQPGWDNCKTVVEAWLAGKFDAALATPPKGGRE